MSSAAPDDKQDVSSALNVHKIYGFANIPVDIVRKIFEVSVDPSSTVDDDHQRQQIAYGFCLVSKDVKDWVEPLLYEKAVLDSNNKVVIFLNALKRKPREFIARTVKKVWILDQNLDYDAIAELHRLFSRCLSLKGFACLGEGLCAHALKFLPIRFSHSHPLQELTIIQPDRTTASFLPLYNVSIQKLQLIDAKLGFFDALNSPIMWNGGHVDLLRVIPYIFVDFTTVPSKRETIWIKSKFLPLLHLDTPDSSNTLYIRSGPAMARDLDPADGLDDVDSWVRSFDGEVQRYGGRLVVCSKLVTEVSVHPGAPHYRLCKPWIGLYE